MDIGRGQGARGVPAPDHKPEYRPKLDRLVYHVATRHWHGLRPDQWSIMREGSRNIVHVTCTQLEAIEWAVDLAKAAWEKGRPAQVKVHGMDGRIRFELTFGKDPRKKKG